MKAIKAIFTWALLTAAMTGFAWLYVQAWDAEWAERDAKMRERGIIEPWEKPAGFIETARGR
jgi:hypothetical protein